MISSGHYQEIHPLGSAEVSQAKQASWTPLVALARGPQCFCRLGTRVEMARMSSHSPRAFDASKRASGTSLLGAWAPSKCSTPRPMPQICPFLCSAALHPQWHALPLLAAILKDASSVHQPLAHRQAPRCRLSRQEASWPTQVVTRLIRRFLSVPELFAVASKHLRCAAADGTGMIADARAVTANKFLSQAQRHHSLPMNLIANKQNSAF